LHGNKSEADSLKRVFGLPTLVIYGLVIFSVRGFMVIGKIAGLSGFGLGFVPDSHACCGTHGFKLRRTRQPISKVEESPTSSWGVSH